MPAEPRALAEALARAVGGFWAERLGSRLLGFYLLGSLAHGGYSARYSDIDVGLVAEEGVEDADIAAMRAFAAASDSELAPKLSLFWADRAFSRGRFPPLDRLDYIDHARPLVERARILPPRPDRAEVRDYLRGQPFVAHVVLTQKFASAAALDPAERKPFLRTILYPARLLYSWESGRMASNDTAVAFLKAHPPDGLDLGLIERALACRHDNSDPDPLFPERAKLLAQRDACAKVMGP